MRLESLQELRAFVRVIDAGGFTAAAKAFGVTTNAMSRWVARLEGRLEVKLLSRTTRRVAATEEGRRLYDHAVRLLRSAEEAEHLTRKSSTSLQGAIRIAVRSTTVHQGFVRRLVELLQANPELRVQLIVSDDEIDLIAGAVDVALRVGEMPDSSHRRVALGKVQFVPCAAPGYAVGKGMPKRPAELAGHECIRAMWQRPQSVWHLIGPRRRQVAVAIGGRFECDDVGAQAEAIYGGLGIGLRPSGEVDQAIAAGTLVRVLSGWSLAPLPVYALLSPQRMRSARIDAVLKLLKEVVQGMADGKLDQARPSANVKRLPKG